MVTNLLIIPGDCCIGGVRHILSSFSVLGVMSSPTRILSKLPSSTPFPSHRPHGNLHSTHVLFNFLRTPRSKPHHSRYVALEKTCSLVGMSCDLIADHNTLHQPLCVEACVIMTHLHCGQLSQILALREGERSTVTSNTQKRSETQDMSSFC